MDTIPLAHPDHRSLVYRSRTPSHTGYTTFDHDPRPAVRDSSVIIVTNRGPVEFVTEENGTFTTRPGSGGVVTVIADALSQVPDMDVIWVALARTPGDRAAFARGAGTRTIMLKDRLVRLRYVSVPESAYHGHYNVLSNEVLWFLQHYLWAPERTNIFTSVHEKAWLHGYCAVNDALAEAAVAAAQDLKQTAPTRGRPPVILVHDYQLYLVPGHVRALLPEAILAHFVHIPWPVMRYWEFLPHSYMLEIFSSLAQCNLLGFQTPLDASNYLQAAQQVFAQSRVDLHRGALALGTHQLRVGHYPVTIDAEGGREIALAAKPSGAPDVPTGNRSQAIAALKSIVRVDRCEPTKNILRGFQAYELLLEQHPELRGQVHFRAFLTPSRQDVPLYQRYARQVEQTVLEINQRFQTTDWLPIQVIVGHHRPRALAAMREADVVLVNPLMDGMNLVAKEAAVVNGRDGLLVLSRTAGAHHELAGACLSISPTDIRATAQALLTALTMPTEVRRQLAQRACAIVEARSPATWLLDQIADAREAHAAVGNDDDGQQGHDLARSLRHWDPVHAAKRTEVSTNIAVRSSAQPVLPGIAAHPGG